MASTNFYKRNARRRDLRDFGDWLAAILIGWVIVLLIVAAIWEWVIYEN